MPWDVLTQCYSKTITKVLRFNSVTKLIFTIPQETTKPLIIRYGDANNGGKVSCVVCTVHKTYTENVPMWAFRITFPEGEDYIIYRIYNEIYTTFTCNLYDDGSFKVFCPKKMRKVPLDENGKIIYDTKMQIIEIPRKEEKIPNFADVVKNINEDVKLRRNSA